MSTVRAFMTDQLEFSKFFNDFQDYNAADWVITTVEAGAGSATEAASDADGGVLVITNDAADDDSDFFQSNKEIFKFVVGKRLAFQARFKVSDATQCDFVMGLQIRDTSPLSVTDGIFFQKDDGDALLDFHAKKDSTASDLTACATVVADTYLKVGFYYDGSDDRVRVFVDDVEVGEVPLTNVVDDEELAVSFGIQNGEAVAKVMSVDYILVAKER